MANEPSKKELYDAAEKMNKEEWNPKKALGDLGTAVLKKIMPKETAEPVPPMPAPGLPTDKKAKGGMVHHSEHYKKHAAGHMVHMDHIKKNFKGK